MPITAVTFDLWDTLVIDDSDESVRAGRGLLPKPKARRALFSEEIAAHHSSVDRDLVLVAWEKANAAFRHAWKEEHHTPNVAWRVDRALAVLGLDRTPGFDRLVDAIERMEVAIPPRPVEGIHDALDAIAGRYRLCIVSDAIVTPGRYLREIMEGHGLRKYFQAFVFSDEVGASKPAAAVFEQASELLATPLHEMVHVGDREANDVVGPLAVGMKAILFTAAVDRGSEGTAANAVCSRAAQLPNLLKGL